MSDRSTARLRCCPRRPLCSATAEKSWPRGLNAVGKSACELHPAYLELYLERGQHFLIGVHVG